ncbi:MAG TPA: hypothetical protein VGK96_05860 [Candidatus Sulfotelmatobacter sp.]
MTGEVLVPGERMGRKFVDARDTMRLTKTMPVKLYSQLDVDPVRDNLVPEVG